MHVISVFIRGRAAKMSFHTAKPLHESSCGTAATLKCVHNWISNDTLFKLDDQISRQNEWFKIQKIWAIVFFFLRKSHLIFLILLIFYYNHTEVYHFIIQKKLLCVWTQKFDESTNVENQTFRWCNLTFFSDFLKSTTFRIYNGHVMNSLLTHQMEWWFDGLSWSAESDTFLYGTFC